MGQWEASASIWRYNVRMVSEARYTVPRNPGAPTNPAKSGHQMTPEELAEFMAPLEYDERPPAPEGCADYAPEYND